MDLLLYLVSRAGEVVSIDEMIEQVWQGKPMTSSSVYNSLNQLRQALGDDSRNPSYIENIPRRGYRLVADVDAIVGAEAPSGARESRRTSSQRFLFISAGLFIILLMAVYWTTRQVTPVPVRADVPDRSVAVLPFVDLSPGGDQAYFAHGVSEQILSDISRIPDLRVAGRTSSSFFTEADQDLREIGRILGVAFLLDGSVRREGDRLRISVQMVSTENGFRVFSREFEATVGEVFRIQDDIARSIADELQLQMVRQGVDQQQPQPSGPDIGAYDLLLLARERIRRSGLRELEEAVEYLQEAIRIEPEYAEAHAELAYAWTTLVNSHRTEYPPSQWSIRDGLIMQHAQRAVTLDPELADAHFVLGVIHQNVAASWEDIEMAESAYRRALEINPSHARSHLWLSGLMRIKRASWNERIKGARRARELEPMWTFPHLFFVELAESMPSLKAEKWAVLRELKARPQSPQNLRQVLWKEIDTLLLEGRLAEAVQAGEAFLASGEEDVNFPLPSTIRGMYASALYRMGAHDEVRKRPELILPYFEVDYPGGSEAGEPSYSELCSTDAKPAAGNAVLCAYEDLLRGKTQRALDHLEKNLQMGLMDFRTFRDWHFTINNIRSPVITLATIHKLNGRMDLALQYAEIEEAVLNTESEGGAIVSPVFSRTRARLHALRNEHELALDELDAMLGMGNTLYDDFMHPVFNELRVHPRFHELLERWIDTINTERAKLGMAPLEPNPFVGPGELPFILED